MNYEAINFGKKFNLLGIWQNPYPGPTVSYLLRPEAATNPQSQPAG